MIILCSNVGKGMVNIFCLVSSQSLPGGKHDRLVEWGPMEEGEGPYHQALKKGPNYEGKLNIPHSTETRSKRPADIQV